MSLTDLHLEPIAPPKPKRVKPEKCFVCPELRSEDYGGVRGQGCIECDRGTDVGEV